MKEIKIYPCVCGGDVEIESLLSENKWFKVSCKKCNRKTEVCWSIRSAIRKWNKWMKQLHSVKYLTNIRGSEGEDYGSI